MGIIRLFEEDCLAESASCVSNVWCGDVAQVWDVRQD